MISLVFPLLMLALEPNTNGTRLKELVSLEGVPELKLFSETAEWIEIGAGLTLSEIEERWSAAPPRGPH